MIKIILLIIVFSLIVYIGYGILSYYNKKKKFYNDLTLFLEQLKSEICFLKTDLKTILEKYKNCYCKEINNLLNDYYNYLCGKFNENLNLKCSLLGKEEIAEINQFFLKLGRTTIEEQKDCIAHYNDRFTEQLRKTSEEKDKSGIVAFKLCIILGLFAVIMLI